MKNNIKKLLFLIYAGAVYIAITCTIGCNKPVLEDNNVMPPLKSSVIFDAELFEGIIVLGDQLKNPYTVKNMQTAYDNVITGGGWSYPQLILSPTHYYIRFLPDSEDELDILKRERNLELFQCPIDFEVIQSGSYYHDPSVPEGKITWQYTSVPVNFSFPNVYYEILDDLYLPDETNQYDEDFCYEMELAALKLTNNYDSLFFSTPKGNWNPSGKIQVWDHVINNYIPLKGVKVVVNNWFKIKSTTTDANGNFSTASFKTKVYYKIKWETGDYDIRSGTFGQAKLKRGGLHSSAWNLNIESDYAQMYYATVHIAAYRYHNQNIDGLRRPGYAQSLKYCVYDSNGSVLGMNWANIDPFGILPDIQIWAKSNNGYRPSNGVFSTAIHETAHASHRKYMTGIQYAQVSNIIAESWARAVQWKVTQIEYAERGYSNYDVPPWSDDEQRHRQNWKGENDYSPLFIDLIDDYNQALLYTGVVFPTNRCPEGGSFNGTDCHIATAPINSVAFIYNNNFYYTPLEIDDMYRCNCPLPDTWFDGSNCFVRTIPNNVIPFISWQRGMYFRPAGDSRYPYDDVKGYTLAYIETNILKNAYGLSSLLTKLKQNKPVGVTDRQLEILFLYYFNI